MEVTQRTDDMSGVQRVGEVPFFGGQTIVKQYRTYPICIPNKFTSTTYKTPTSLWLWLVCQVFRRLSLLERMEEEHVQKAMSRDKVTGLHICSLC